jgi:hypothetical protein
LFDEDAFRSLVKCRGVKLKAVAAAMGMDPATLYRKMKGNFDFKRSEIQRCCDFFGLDEMNEIFFNRKVT